MSLERQLGGEKHAQAKQAPRIAHADSHRSHVGRGIDGGRNRHDLTRESLRGEGVRGDGQPRSHSDLAQIERRDISKELDFVEVRDLEERSRRRAVHLLPDAGKPLDDGPSERRADLGARQLQPGEGERGFGLAERRLVHAQLRAGVFHVLASRDAPLEQTLVAIAVQARVLDVRLGLLDRRLSLLDLIEEGPVLDFGEHLARANVVALSHHHAGNAALDQRADLGVAIRKRRNGARNGQRRGNIGARYLGYGDLGRRIGRAGGFVALVAACRLR